MNNHTPGPWTASRMRLSDSEKDRRCGFVVNGPDSDPLPTRICDMRVPAGVAGFSEGRSNAHLIAAAPDLLATLKDISAYFAAIDAMQPERKHGVEGERLRNTVSAAIAQAEGRDA